MNRHITQIFLRAASAQVKTCSCTQCRALLTAVGHTRTYSRLANASGARAETRVRWGWASQDLAGRSCLRGQPGRATMELPPRSLPQCFLEVLMLEVLPRNPDWISRAVNPAAVMEHVKFSFPKKKGTAWTFPLITYVHAEVGRG